MAIRGRFLKADEDTVRRSEGFLIVFDVGLCCLPVTPLGDAIRRLVNGSFHNRHFVLISDQQEPSKKIGVNDEIASRCGFLDLLRIRGDVRMTRDICLLHAREEVVFAREKS